VVMLDTAVGSLLYLRDTVCPDCRTSGSAVTKLFDVAAAEDSTSISSFFGGDSVALPSAYWPILSDDL